MKVRRFNEDRRIEIDFDDDELLSYDEIRANGGFFVLNTRSSRQIDNIDYLLVDYGDRVVLYETELKRPLPQELMISRNIINATKQYKLIATYKNAFEFVERSIR